MFYTTPTPTALSGMHIALPSYTSTSYNPPPTPTYTGSAGDDDDDSGSGGSVFSMNGSPPLIVAFLAIGLFTVSMSAIFAWRRMRQGRSRVANGAATTTRSLKKQVNLADKPVLREVYMTTVEGLLVEDLQWDQLMPFAATLHYPAPPSLPLAPGNGGVVSQETSLWSRLTRIIKNYAQPSQAFPPATLTGSDSSDEKDRPLIEALEEVAEGTRMDIAVTIAMPSPHTRHGHDLQSRTPHRNSISDGENGVETIPDFCIGTLSVPLYEGG